MVQARAWCRVDLAGGTLDIWPLGQLVENARTLSVAVSLPVVARATLATSGDTPIQSVPIKTAPIRIEMADAGSVEGENWQQIRSRPETALVGVIAQALRLPPMHLQLSSASPRGAGLGASSALAVALIAACEGAQEGAHTGSTSEPLPLADLHRYAAMARDLEARLMRLPTGTQDHYAALLGGVVELTYPPGGSARAVGSALQRLEIDLDALGDHLVVAYSGQSHISADTNWQVIRRFLDGERRTVECFDGISEAANALRSALLDADFEAVGTAMADEWRHRSRLAPDVSTPRLESMLTAARDQGAWGGKACGAGGGGCLAVLCPPETRSKVEAALEAEGGQLLAARPVAEGMTLSA